jgi:hypothetical protein
MKFFNLDCHISVIADIKKILEELGHSVESWSISGHNWVFNRNPTNVDIITPSSWKGLNQKMCDDFYTRYRDELSEYDAFICTYPPSFSMLFENFNKPIILYTPIRYEVPFHNDKIKWETFNEFLRKNIDSKKIIPIANSEYDKKYFEFFVKRDCKLIPNICDYTNTKWSPSKNKFLYSSRLNVNLDTSIIENKNNLIRYQWEDLSKYNGIIIIPYNCSTMSIYEHYAANIPLFCPTQEFMIELYSKYGHSVLSELTWNQTFGLPPGSVIDCDRTNDPNNYTNINIISNWVKYSDFYNEEWMPYITYFNSFEDLYSKLKTTNLKEINSKMKSFNIIRKNNIIDMWKNILLELETKN